MRLTREEVERIRSWKDGELFIDYSRPRKLSDAEPMLPKVCFSIVARHAHKAKTARGKLRRAAKAIGLVLDVLKSGA